MYWCTHKSDDEYIFQQLFWFSQHVIIWIVKFCVVFTNYSISTRYCCIKLHEYVETLKLFVSVFIKWLNFILLLFIFFVYVMFNITISNVADNWTNCEGVVARALTSSRWAHPTRSNLMEHLNLTERAGRTQLVLTFIKISYTHFICIMSCEAE